VRIPAISFLFLILLSVPVTSLEAQEWKPLRFDILPETCETMVGIVDLFSDPSLVEAVLSGLPLRIRLRVQLWKHGFFDNQKDQYDWRASVLFDPPTRRYRVQTNERAGAEVEVNTLEEAQNALQLTLNIPLRPGEPGRYYYIAAVELETLSLSDLEELQRWLQGDLAPVVAGEGEVEGALAKGVKRVLVRMLGLPAKRSRVQSPSCRVESREGTGDLGESQRSPFVRPAFPTAGR